MNGFITTGCLKTSREKPDISGVLTSGLASFERAEEGKNFFERAKPARVSKTVDQSVRAKNDTATKTRDTRPAKSLSAKNQTEPGKVFADPSRKRGRRVLSCAMTLTLLASVWITLFVVQLLSQEAALAHASDTTARIPDFPVSEQLGSWSGSPPSNGAIPSPGNHAMAASGHPDCGTETDRTRAATSRIYAFVAQSTPWASHSLKQSCNAISVMMPERYSMGIVAGRLTLTEIETQRKSRPNFQNTQRETRKEVMPVITLDQSAVEGFQRAPGAESLAADLPSVLGVLSGSKEALGFCLDLSSAEITKNDAVADALRRWTEDARKTDFKTCLVLSGTMKPARLAALSESVDTVVLKVFEEPWISSLPGPLAAQDWFIKTVEQALVSAGPEKLVIALGAGPLTG